MNYNDFISFLKENNTHYEYIKNLYIRSNLNAKELYRNTDVEFMIMDAFKWSSTEQGSEYWDKINDKLNNKLKEENVTNR